MLKSMARRSIPDENIRNIQKSNRCYYVTIPIQLVREFKWQEGQKVVLEKVGKEKILIRDWEKK